MSDHAALLAEAFHIITDEAGALAHELDAISFDAAVHGALAPLAAALREAEWEGEDIRRERDAHQFFIETRGYRKCDIPACNCGSWHGGHSAARLEEIHTLLEDAIDMNGHTVLGGVRSLIDQIHALRAQIAADHARCDDSCTCPFADGHCHGCYGSGYTEDCAYPCAVRVRCGVAEEEGTDANQ